MMTVDEIKQAQAAVNAAGYTPALTVDGIIGPKTTAGISWLQAKKGLPVTGSVTEEDLGKLGTMTGVVHKKIKLPPMGAKTVATSAGALAGLPAGPLGVAVGAGIGFLSGWAYSKWKGNKVPIAALPAHVATGAPIGAIISKGPPAPEPVFDKNGMSNGEFIASIVRHYEGASLSNRRDELGALVGRGVDDPNAVVGIKTNCAMFALGVLKAAGVQHPLLNKPYVNGMAFAWVVQIGNDTGAWRTPDQGSPPEGAAMWYRTGGNDDHIEFMLTPPDEHGGGGRSNNAITIERGDISRSVGRPLYKWLDPNAVMGEP